MRSAYGFGLTGPLVEGVPDVLPTVENPTSVIEVSTADGLPTEDRLDATTYNRAWFEGRLLVTSDPLQATFSTHSRPGSDLLLHPGLTTIAAATAHWRGWLGFHAGAVLAHDGRAWVVSGPKRAGKSTTMAALGLDGSAIFSDDLAVVEGLTVHAGPAIVDLRQEAAAKLAPPEVHTVEVRGGRRQRVHLQPGPASAPLGGFVFLRAGPHEIRRLDASEVLAWLASCLTFPAIPRDPTSLLDLVTRPAYVFTRPLVWDELDRSLDRLHEMWTASGEHAEQR